MASCVNLILILATHVPVFFLPQYALEIAALLLAPILTSLNHYRSRTSSSLLLLFWPVYISAFVVWARTVLSVSTDTFRIVVALRGAIAALGLVALVVECFGTEFTPEDGPGELVHGHVESPLLTANLFSEWSFSWMNPLMEKGASTYITENDLPALVPKDESATLGDTLRKAMDKQCVAFTSVEWLSCVLTLEKLVIDHRAVRVVWRPVRVRPWP